MSIFFLVRCLEPELKTCPSASPLIPGSLAKTFSQTCHLQSYFSHSLEGNDLPALHLPFHFPPPFPRQLRIRPCKSRTPLVFLLRKTNKEVTGSSFQTVQLTLAAANIFSGRVSGHCPVKYSTSPFTHSWLQKLTFLSIDLLKLLTVFWVCSLSPL